MFQSARPDLLPLDCRPYRVVQRPRQFDTDPGVPAFDLVDGHTGHSVVFGVLKPAGAVTALRRGATT